jgi:hypothetical protein
VLEAAEAADDMDRDADEAPLEAVPEAAEAAEEMAEETDDDLAIVLEIPGPLWLG